LAEQFYAWELRGRGWEECSYPVALEPPFRPFPGYFLPRARDDSHRPTFLSRFLSPPREEIDLPEAEEPEPTAFQSALPLIELRISLPGEATVKAESAERLLLALSGAALPLAFEIVGLPEGLAVQMVSRAPDAALLGNQLRAFFPEVSLEERPEGLRQAWTREEGATALVQFGLAREFMLPLTSFRAFEPDPLLPLFGALAELEPGEAGLVQILFERVREPWAESVMRAIVAPGGKPFFADYPELTAHAREKVSRPLFAACLRLAAKSADRDGAWRILSDLTSALTHFGSPATNEVIPLSLEAGREAVSEMCLRTSRRPGMILGVDELGALVHPPSASVKIPRLIREGRRSKMAPAVSQGEGILLGENVHHGRSMAVRLPDALRLRHLHVIGASGSGKSTFLLDLVSQDIASGRGVAVIDPHGDLVDEILGRIPEERLDEAILFDPADTEHPLAWNILEAHSELERTLLASDLVGLFRRFSTSWGDQMTSVLGNAVLVLLEHPGSTLLDLREFLVDRTTREQLLRGLDDPYLLSYFRHEFQLAAGKSVGAILTRLDGFLRSKRVREIVGARESRLDLREVVDRGQIFLARLSEGAVGEENAALLGSLLVSKFHQVAMSRQEIRREERRPFFLYADECQEVATPSMAQLLSGARKYDLGLALAHQDLRQLDAKAPEVASALMANAGTRLAFRVSERDAKTLSEGLSFFGPADLLSLRVGEAIARIDTAEGDCNLRTRLLPFVDAVVAAERRERVIRRSRERYTVSREASRRAAPQAPPPPAPEPRREDQQQATAPREQALTPPAPLAPPTVVSPPPLPKRETRENVPVPPLGRGGPEHQYLQDLVKRWAETHGYRATIEEEIPGGSGSVDIALRTDDFSLACEISVTSTVRQEVGNVLKCLDAGFHEVAVLALKRPHLVKIQAALKDKLSAADLSRVHFLTPEELFTMLAMRPVTRETVVGGYKVKVRHEAVDPDEAAARYKALTEVVAKSVRRMKGGEKP
jgi:hypothetical protein